VSLSGTVTCGHIRWAQEKGDNPKIEEKRMASLREATDKLREMSKFLDDLYRELDDDYHDTSRAALVGASRR
jgi:hypothetical protein